MAHVTITRLAGAAAALALALASPLASAFVTLPDSGPDIRVQGSNNSAIDPLYLAASPFTTGHTLLALLAQPLTFDLDGNGSQDWVGTFSDGVWRNDATGALTFGARLELVHPMISPDNDETEINLIWRSGFTGYGTAVAWFAQGEGGTDPDGYAFDGDFRLQAAARVADGFVIRAGAQADRVVPASAYNADTVAFRTDTSVDEGAPSSGWYLVRTDATRFTLETGLVHIRQSAGTGPEARPQRDWVLAGLTPVAPVPEPATWAMWLSGALALGWMGRRRV